MLELQTNTGQTTEDRVPLFSIDGKEYSIPAKPRPSIELKFLYLLKQEGPEMATAIFLSDLLGDEGFEALTNYEDLTKEQFEQVVEIAKQTALGGLEPGTKN